MSTIDSFIQERRLYRTLRPQLVIVLLAGVTFSLDMVVIYLSLGDAMQIYGGVAILLAVLSVLVPPVLWLGATTLIYFLGRLVGAHMQFGTLLRTSGWGTVPAIGTGLSLAAGRYITLRGTNACEHPAFTCDPGYLATLQEQVTAIHSFAASMASAPLFEFFFAVATLCLLLTGYIWVIAIDEASTLTRAGAILVVTPPTIFLAVLFAVVTF